MSGLPPYEPRPGSIPTLSVPDPRTWRSLHLIGIGGAGMRGIAQLLRARGFVVTGSDLKDSPGLDALREAGATVSIGHRTRNVGTPDAVVMSSAVPVGNIEVRHAQDRGIPVLMRAQVLAALMRDTRGVAVAGAHGKTTTTSMISAMLAHAGLDPTFVIGGDLNDSGSSAGFGSGEVFVAETDESDGSFLLLSPEIAVLTNVEPDHLDFYRDRDEVERAFAAFASRSATVVACWDDPGVRRVLEGRDAAIMRYGTGLDVDVRVTSCKTSGGRSSGSVEVHGSTVEVDLTVPGSHNLLNAAAAIAVGGLLGLDLRVAAAGLASFGGVRRRFERRGSAAGASFVDDYAHHPTEVRATLAAVHEERSRLVAVFQPHRYTRTQAMWRELGESLAGADVVILTDVYGANEQPIPGVTGKLLVEALTEAAPRKRVVYLPRRSQIAPFLADEVRPGDLVLTLGAGNVTNVAEETIERIREREEARA